MKYKREIELIKTSRLNCSKCGEMHRLGIYYVMYFFCLDCVVNCINLDDYPLKVEE